jgi:hypothetical protein
MDDPLEAAVFSVLVEMMKEMEENNSVCTDRLQELQTAKMGR